jgi:hypothetical protein
VLVTVPVVDHANVFAPPDPDVEVKRTVGGLAGGVEETIDQLAVALELPALFETVTRKV